MKSYYVLDWDFADTIVGHVDDQNTPSLENKYTRGFALKQADLPSGLTVQVEMGPATYPDFFTLQQIPIASKAFVDRLWEAGIDNVDAYPAPIIESSREIAGYFVLNVVGRVSCLDTDNTEATFVDDEIFRLKKLAIDPSEARDLKLFRLHEFELVILASEQVARAVGGLNGVSLISAQGWSDSVWF